MKCVCVCVCVCVWGGKVVLSKVNVEDYLFLGGDNCTENDLLDRNHVEPHRESQSALKQVLNEHDLTDVWRRTHGDGRQHTWAHSTGILISLARLDRFYCFKHHLSIFKKCGITPVGFTDHSVAFCNVFIANLKHKSAYWHYWIIRF